MNILSWKGEYIILEEGSQTKTSQQPFLGRIAQLPQVSRRAMETVQTLSGYCLIKETTAFHNSLNWIPRAAITEGTSRCCWAWTGEEAGNERNSAPLPTPAATAFCSSIFLSTTATSHFWTSDRQLPKLDHLAFINRHNHKAPRTWARWKVKFSNIHEQKHLHTKDLLLLGEV